MQQAQHSTLASTGTQRLQAVVFDFDGTLVDSLGVWDEIGVDWVRRNGLDDWPTMQSEMAVLTLRAAAQLAVDHYGLKNVCASTQCVRDYHARALQTTGILTLTLFVVVVDSVLML